MFKARTVFVLLLAPVLFLQGCANHLAVRGAASPPIGPDALESAVGSGARGGLPLELRVGELLKTPVGGGPWEPFALPGKRFVAFTPDTVLNRPALSVQSDRSVSILRQRFPAGRTIGLDQLRFSWKVDGLPLEAKLSEQSREDSAVRIVLSFDGDRGKLSSRHHRLSEMSRLLTGEDLPYATLMYVWSDQDPPESLVLNPRTDRIRKLVVESGREGVGQWRMYQRNVREDFIRAFGEEPGELLAVGLMTDTDNTQSKLRAWYGNLELSTR